MIEKRKFSNPPVRERSLKRLGRAVTVLGSVALLIASASAPPVLASTSHPGMECSLSARATPSAGSRSVRVDLECMPSFVGTHSRLKGSTTAILQDDGEGLFIGAFNVHLKDVSIAIYPNKPHPEINCRVDLYSIPDVDGFTALDKYWTHMFCKPSWAEYHPWHYCNPAVYDPVDLYTSPFKLDCRIVAVSTKRTFRWWDVGPDHELNVSAVGKKNGTLIIRLFDLPEITEITVRQFRMNDTISNTRVPVVNGVARLKAKRPGLKWGKIVVGNSEQYFFGDGDGAWVYSVSPTIWWGQ